MGFCVDILGGFLFQTVGFGFHTCWVGQLGADSAYVQRGEQDARAVVKDAGQLKQPRRIRRWVEMRMQILLVSLEETSSPT